MKYRAHRRLPVPDMTPERSAELRARITLADTIFLTYGRARIIIPSLDFPNTNEREFW